MKPFYVTTILKQSKIYIRIPYTIILLIFLFIMKNYYLQINARIQKWREMIVKDTIKSQPEVVKPRVRKGIPAGIRMKVWPLLINLDNFKLQQSYSYQNLLEIQAPNEPQIQADIQKFNISESKPELKKSILEVMKAVSLAHPEIGHCSKLSYLTLQLLHNVIDEDAFWIIMYLIKRNSAFQKSLKNPRYCEVECYLVRKFLLKFMPDLYLKLEHQKIIPSQYTIQWYTTLFSTILPQQIFSRVFECLLVQGNKIIYRAILAMLKLKQNQLLQNPKDINKTFIMNKEFFTKINPNLFIQTMFKFSFSRSDIIKYEMEFKNSNKSNIEKIQIQTQIKSQNNLRVSKYVIGQVSISEQNNNKVNINELKPRSAIREFKESKLEELNA